MMVKWISQCEEGWSWGRRWHVSPLSCLWWLCHCHSLRLRCLFLSFSPPKWERGWWKVLCSEITEEKVELGTELALSR